MIGLTAALLLGLAACGEKGPDVTGKYEAVSATAFGEEATLDGEWIELKSGGKGTFYMGYEFNLNWKLEGETFTGTVSFLGIEEPCNGTLKDGVLTVTYGDFTYVMTKDGAPAPAAAAPVTEPDTEDGTKQAGEDSQTDDGSGTVEPGPEVYTTAIANPSDWYGWMSLSEIWGVEVDEDPELHDVWGYVDEDEDGNIYFEVYREEDIDHPVLSMYVTIEDDGTRLMPVVGEEDAWLVDAYIKEVDAADYQVFLYEDGSLAFSCAYTSEDGELGCNVTIFLREIGAQWDEDNDLLPPSYEGYVEAMQDQEEDEWTKEEADLQEEDAG